MKKTQGVFLINCLLIFSITQLPIAFAEDDQKEGVARELILNDDVHVNVNTADAVTLMGIKGIGLMKAKAIIDYRELHGPFKMLSALLHVKGINTKLLVEIMSQLTV